MRKFISNLEEPLRGIVIFAIGIGLLCLLNFGVAKGKDLYARIELSKIEKTITKEIPEKTSLMKSFYYHVDDRYYIYNVIDSDLSQEQIEAFYKATEEYVNKIQSKQFTCSVDSYSYLEDNQGLMHFFEHFEQFSKVLGVVEIVSDKAQYKNKYMISFEYN